MQPQRILRMTDHTMPDHNSHQTMIGCEAAFPYIPGKASVLHCYKWEKQSLYMRSGDVGPQRSLALEAG